MGRRLDSGDNLQPRLEAIINDRERGATELARAVLDTLEWAAERDGVRARVSGDAPVRLDLFTRAARTLARARPSMVAIENAVRHVTTAPRSVSGPAVAADACRRARTWLDAESNGAVERAAALLPVGAVVATCSYSSAVVRACARAASERRLRVLALESQVGLRTFGHRVRDALSGVDRADCLVVPDERMGDLVAGATLVLTGADCVEPDGSLVNGTPSRRLAEAARSAGVPFYAICEAFKLVPSDRSKGSLEAGFDRIPAQLVTGYVSARGVVSPDRIGGRQAGRAPHS